MQAKGLQHAVVKAAMRAPYLERDVERALAVRWRVDGDQVALDQLAASHLRLVISIASKFRHYGLPLSDLVQEGNVGLLEAAARFDVDREVRFSTYAVWWIRASIQDYILRNWSIVRGGTSAAQKSLFFNLRRLRARLSSGGDIRAAAVVKTIARAIGVSQADVEIMNVRLSAPDLSLNAPAADSDDLSGSERVDNLVDSRPLQDEVVAEIIDEARRTRWLADALKALNARELQIVRERHLRDNATTLESLGAMLGISKERVRQIESRAMEKLRQALQTKHSAEEIAALTVGAFAH